MKKKGLSLLLAGMMVLSLAACGGQPKEQTNQSGETNQTGNTTQAFEENTGAASDTGTGKQDTLTIALPVEPATLDPFEHSNQNGFICTTLITEPLIKKTDDGELIPWLAKSWEFTDDQTLVMEVRDDVTFHDGSTMKAEDVKFTLCKLAESSFSKALFGSIDVENTKTTGDYTLEIKLLYPYAPLLEAFTTPRAGIVSEAVYNEMGPEKFARNPVGTGPMKFKQWITGDRIEFEEYEGYWGEKPAFKNFTARVSVEGSSRAIELETGGVDVAFELAPADWKRIDENPNTQLISGNTRGVSYLCLNNSLEPIKGNLKLRQAMAYGLDMTNLVQAAWQGTADVATSFYANNIMGHKVEGPLEYNPEKAKELLAEAGYPDGIELTYMTYESAINQAFAEVLQNMWGKVGIQLKVEFLDLATFTEKNNAGEITMALMTNTAALNDPDPALIAWPGYRTISLRHGDAHIDELLEKGKSTYDEAARIETYQELQDYLWENLYTIPIAYPKGAFGAGANIANLPFYPDVTPDLTRIQFAE